MISGMMPRKKQINTQKIRSSRLGRCGQVEGSPTSTCLGEYLGRLSPTYDVEVFLEVVI